MMGEGVVTGDGAGQQVSFEGLNSCDEVRHLQDLRWAVALSFFGKLVI